MCLHAGLPCNKLLFSRYFDVVKYASLSFTKKNGAESACKELTRENLEENDKCYKSDDDGLVNEVFSTSPRTTLTNPYSQSSSKPLLLTPRPSTHSSESDCHGTVQTEMTSLTARYHIEGEH